MTFSKSLGCSGRNWAGRKLKSLQGSCRIAAVPTQYVATEHGTRSGSTVGASGKGKPYLSQNNPGLERCLALSDHRSPSGGLCKERWGPPAMWILRAPGWSQKDLTLPAYCLVTFGKLKFLSLGNLICNSGIIKHQELPWRLHENYNCKSTMCQVPY